MNFSWMMANRSLSLLHILAWTASTIEREKCYREVLLINTGPTDCAVSLSAFSVASTLSVYYEYYPNNFK